jgi:hypothetical protein
MEIFLMFLLGGVEINGNGDFVTPKKIVPK